MEVSVKDWSLETKWLSKEWEEWNEFRDAPESKELWSKFAGLLNQARDRQSKGAGKGPAAAR